MRPPCIVSGCRSNWRHGQKRPVSMFIVPKGVRRKAWLKVLNLKEPLEYRPSVCQLHFTKNDLVMNSKRKRLSHDAVPSLWLNGAEEEEPLEPTDTDVNEDTDDMPRLKDDPDNAIVDLFSAENTVVQKRTLRESEESTSSLNEIPIKRERCEYPDSEAVENDVELPFETQTFNTPTAPIKQSEFRSFVKLSQAYLTPELAKFVEVQAVLKDELKSAFENKTYSRSVLLFALKLYHSFPNTYKTMYTSLCLPSMMQIRQLCRSLTWEINSSWKKVIGARFEHSKPMERDCVVNVAKVRLSLGLSYDAARDRMTGLDEMDGVQKPRIARYALVVYARGIFSRWRQPLSYSLLPASYRPGRIWSWVTIIITALIDIGLNVRALVTDLDDEFVPTVRPDKPVKSYFQINDKQIYLLYDCTQMIVKFRDCFRIYNMIFNGMIASWNDIEELYEYSETKRYKLAAGLTHMHVKPIGIAARQAKLAVETLAPQVTAGLAAAVELRVLDDSAHGTVQLLTTFSTLYDVLHNKELAIVKNKINSELRFLHDTLVHFDKINFIDKNQMRLVAEPGVINGFRTNVRAALSLQERMRRAGYDSLPMRAFNNDPIYEFSNRLRTANGDKDPTGRQLIDGFKKSFVFNILKSLNKDDKLDEFLCAASAVKDLPIEDCKETVFKGLVKPTHYATLMQVPAEPAYLAAQCLRLKPCCELGKSFCKKPPQGLVEYVCTMERIFRLYFAAENIRTGVLASMLDSLSKSQFPAPCHCFPVLFLQTLYFRFRVANLTKYNNTKFRKGISRDFTMNLNLNFDTYS